MKKKGFTLIELLAVIVILAIVALIITPMISNLILSVNKEVAAIDAERYLDAVEKQLAFNILSNPTSNLANGVYELPLDAQYGLVTKGRKPTEGTIVIIDGKITEGEMCINNYMVTYDGSMANSLYKCSSKPIVTYSLNTTESNQDTVTISISATIDEEGAVIDNITNPADEVINGSTTEYEVSKNGLYRFMVTSSLGSKTILFVEITNIKMESPVINLLQAAGEPVITSYGVQPGKSKIEISYEENSFYRNLYSEDDGATWIEYPGSVIEVTSSKILAKSVASTNENISSDVTTLNIQVNSSIGTTAFDGDFDSYYSMSYNGAGTWGGLNSMNTPTYTNTAGNIIIDSSVIGCRLRIKMYTYGGWHYGYAFFDSNKEYISMGSYGVDNTVDVTVTIPANARYLRFFKHNLDNSWQYVNIYEVQLINSPTFTTENIYPLIKGDGIDKGYNNVTINYHSTAERKMYKINDGEWIETNNQTVRLEYGAILLAKSIDRNNVVSMEGRYESAVGDSVGNNTFDTDYSSYSSMSYNGAGTWGGYSAMNVPTYENTAGNIFFDSSSYGKKIRIKMYTYGGWHYGYAIFDANKNRLAYGTYNVDSNVDVTITIPSGAKYLRFFKHNLDNSWSYVNLYEIQVVE